MTYFDVKIEFKTEDDNGKVKKVKETYLVEAVSVTDAEAIVTKKFEGGMSDFKVSSVSEKKYMDILNKDSI